jgi:two-component system sensor histidine kinase SenX3
VNEWYTFWPGAVAGFVAGGAILGIVVSRFRNRAIETFEEAQSLSDGVAEILEVLASAALVIGRNDQALRATQGVLTYGLLRDRYLVHEELQGMVNRARTSHAMESLDTELITGLRRKTVFVSARAVAMGDSNVLLVIEDRTEARRLDETRRDFIANISHELKTPIGAISLLAETIADAKDDPAAIDKFTKSLTREAKRLSKLVQNIIQLSRFQSTDLFGQADLVDLSTVVSDAVERNQVRAEKRKVSIKFEAPEGVEVFGDAEMLTVAIKNLVENAVNYSDEGSTVGVGISQSQGVAAISVTDSGVGLSPDDQQRIFERFYRVDPSRSRDTGGTGLGLAIVKHVAMNHQGEVHVFSKPGVGSTFTLRLPLADTKIVVSDTERITA